MLKVFIDSGLNEISSTYLEKYKRKIVFSGKDDDCFSESWDIMVFYGSFPFKYEGLAGLFDKFPFCSLFVIPNTLVSPDIHEERIMVYSNPSYMFGAFSKILDRIMELDNKERILENLRSQKDPFFKGREISDFLMSSRKSAYSGKNLLILSEYGIERFQIADCLFPGFHMIKAVYRGKIYEDLIYFLENGILNNDKIGVFVDGLMPLARKEQMHILNLMNRMNEENNGRFILGLEKTETECINFIADLFEIIEIPSIRNRKTDIAPLIVELYFLKAKEHGLKAEIPSARLLQFCENYCWPGNHLQICEFVNTLIFQGEIEALKKISIDFEYDFLNGDGIDLNEIVRNYKNTFEELWIRKTLSKFKNNRKMAASALGISYKSLCYKLKEYNSEAIPEMEK